MAGSNQVAGIEALIKSKVRDLDLENAVIAAPTVTFTQPGSTVAVNIPAFLVLGIVTTSASSDIAAATIATATAVNENRAILNEIVDVMQTYRLVLST